MLCSVTSTTRRDVFSSTSSPTNGMDAFITKWPHPSHMLREIQPDPLEASRLCAWLPLCQPSVRSRIVSSGSILVSTKWCAQSTLHADDRTTDPVMVSGLRARAHLAQEHSQARPSPRHDIISIYEHMTCYVPTACSHGYSTVYVYACVYVCIQIAERAAWKSRSEEAQKSGMVTNT